MVSILSLNDLFLSISSEFILMTYLLCLISYSVLFSNLHCFSFPFMLRSSNAFSIFVMFSLLFMFVSFDLQNISPSNILFSNLFSALLLTALIVLHLISRKTLENHGLFKYEYDVIVMLSVLGLLLLNGCDDFLTLYLAIELQSLSFYILAVFQRNSEYNGEASLKYFILGSLASGFLLFGFALLYTAYGSFLFESVARSAFHNENLLSLLGFSFIFITLLFKLGAFPFHQWLCDVYEGAFITVTAFFSVAPKAIIFALFIRLLCVFLFDFLYFANFVVVFSGLLSISFASITALYQKRMKRLLAYSAISHTGFILVAITCNSVDAVKTSIVYMVIYVLMTIAVFSVLFVVLESNKIPKFLINWSLISKHNLTMALTFSCVLFSVAGIPPLAGFFSKLFVLGSLFYDGFFILPCLIAIFSSIGCFYYIRLVKMFFFSSDSKTVIWTGLGSGKIELVLSILTVAITSFIFNTNVLVDSALLASFTLS